MQPIISQSTLACRNALSVYFVIRAIRGHSILHSRPPLTATFHRHLPVKIWLAKEANSHFENHILSQCMKFNPPLLKGFSSLSIPISILETAYYTQQVLPRYERAHWGSHWVCSCVLSVVYRWICRVHREPARLRKTVLLNWTTLGAILYCSICRDSISFFLFDEMLRVSSKIFNKG